MKKNNKKVEVETKVIEQPKVETVVETPKKKRKHYRKPKVKVQPVEDTVQVPRQEEIVIPSYSEELDSIKESIEIETKPTLTDLIAGIIFGWKTVPGFWNKIKWTYQFIKLNK